MKHVRPFILCCLIASAPAALAARVELPLRLPLEAIRHALEAHLEAPLRDGPCRSLRVHAPKLEARDARLQLSADAAARFGVELFGRCQSAGAWQGSLALTLEPRLDSAGRLRLHVVDSRLADRGNAPAVSVVWELAKHHLHPRLQHFSFDIGAARTTLLGLLGSVAPLSQVDVLAPRVETTAIVVPVAVEFPDAWLAAPAPAPASTAPLTEAELEALDEALQPWDAFVAYSVKQFALDAGDGALRQRLFTLLLDSRYRLSSIVSGDASSAGDPVRALFVDAWTELRAIIADAQRNGSLDASLLRYAVFLDAGDALVALDRAAPGLAMRLSADGLRQLARSLRPGVAGDPLAFAWDVDPELARLFQVEEPPMLPPRRSFLDFFIAPAYASDAAAEKALDRWVPRRNELDRYETRVGALLERAAAAELARTSLAPPYQSIYEHLVPTTALIESCWRQYVMRRGEITYLRSSAGSVGLMQVNQRVWRGLYDVQRLRWDTAYNVRAGAQILMRYLKDYAIPYAERSGDANHVPRAAYAVYNAGPRAVGRFAKSPPHPREKRVDDHLWTLYQGIAAGGRADLRTCGVEAESEELVGAIGLEPTTPTMSR